MANIYRQCTESPLGKITVEGNERAIYSIRFTNENEDTAGFEHPNELTNTCCLQLHEYFAGKRKRFGIPIQLKGTEFQYHVWDALKDIAFGETCSYMELAKKIGKPDAVRAVGTANGDNPIAVIVPCHRVVGSDGKLTGYAGGLWRKHWLLEHEQKVLGKLLSLF